MQQVRSRIHDSIQSLHGVMPLWGIDHWVPLGDLFVDVNILESLSSSRRSELDDLWQDFTTGNSSYRSLDRIGLGKEQQRVSGLAVLERNTNLMVVGKPGSGKTTYLQRIVTECNAGKLKAQRIPVLIKLREFVDDGHKYAYNLEQFLGQLWRLNNAEIELVLNQGRVLVLLDGLDEVTGEAGKQIANEIKQFARVYPQVQVVVTSRTQSQESRFERFDYVEVADFNEEQVRAFAAHWFVTVCADAEKGKTKAREFLEQLFREENKAIRELAITPILLSLTCAVFHQTGKFYSKRSKLYEEGLELLLVQWDKSRSVERDEVYRDLSVERKLELLSYVAVKKFEQEQYVLFEQEELEGYIGEFLGIELRESRGVLQAIASQHGLLIERSHKVWSFSHLTFQEYLVAKQLCERGHKLSSSFWEKLEKHWQDQYWYEIFILISGLIDVQYVGKIISFLLSIDGRKVDYSNLFLAAECLAQVRDYSTILEISNDLFNRLTLLIQYIDRQTSLNFEDFQLFFKIYSSAFAAISKTWKDQYTLSWLKYCIHSEENFRDGYMGGYFAIKELVRWWKDNPDTLLIIKKCANSHVSNSQNLQEASVQELSNYWKDDPETLNILKECAKNSENYRVRWSAIKGLSSILKDKSAMFKFIHDIILTDSFQREHHSQRNPRIAALEVMIEQFPYHIQILEILQTLIQQDSDEQLRELAHRELMNRISFSH